MKKEKRFNRVVMKRPSHYKRDPNRIVKDIQLEMVCTKDQMSKLIELAEPKGCTRQEVIRRLIEEEHLRQYKES